MEIHIHIKTAHAEILREAQGWCTYIADFKQVEDVALSVDGFVNFKPREEVKE